MKKVKEILNKNYTNVITGLALIEAIVLLTISFGYWNKIDKQKEEIKTLKQEIEQVKPCYYECYKKIELKAERSGK